MTDNNRDENVFDLFEEFFEAMRRAAEDGDPAERGQFGDGPTRIEFSCSVSSGLDPDAEGRRGRPRFEVDSDVSSRRNPGGPAGRRSDPSKRRDAADEQAEDRPVRVDATDDGQAVTVDLVDSDVTDPSDVTVAVADDSLTVDREGATLATASLDDGSWTLDDVTVNNGVLRARVVDDA
ncbi:alpha-crystallin domain-containing protein [Halosimplex salinum]|uniref:hypothetical protein n=1 Tax=Halosimplex salinum TaxID=1710538 RepID=UPI000F49E60A|nr:hypothetical protein [Halosimplex salinum]